MSDQLMAILRLYPHKRMDEVLRVVPENLKSELQSFLNSYQQARQTRCIQYLPMYNPSRAMVKCFYANRLRCLLDIAMDLRLAEENELAAELSNLIEEFPGSGYELASSFICD